MQESLSLGGRGIGVSDVGDAWTDSVQRDTRAACHPRCSPDPPSLILNDWIFHLLHPAEYELQAQQPQLGNEHTWASSACEWLAIRYLRSQDLWLACIAKACAHVGYPTDECLRLWFQADAPDAVKGS